MKNLFKIHGKNLLHTLVAIYIISPSGVSFACDLPTLNTISVVGNGGGNYTYTVEICLGVDVNWGSTTSFDLTVTGANILCASGIWSSTYQYCDGGCVFMGCSGSILTGGGNCSPYVMGNMVTCQGGSGAGNWLSPDDNDATCLSSPNEVVCDTLFITTDSLLTALTLSFYEVDSACTYTQTSFPAMQPAGGCIPPFSTSFVVTEPSGCGNSDGMIVLMLCGGSSPFTYQWSNGDSTKDLLNVGAGAYSVTVTDSVGCMDSNQIDLYNQGLVLSITTFPVSVCAGSNGSAIVTPSGGTFPYTYLWNTSPVQTDSIADSLSTGTYIVTVTDSANCIGIDTTTIDYSGGPVIVIDSIVPVSCFNDSNGSATISAYGGVLPYSFAWNDPQTQTDTIATALSAGTWNVTVTDSAGCKDSVSVTIPEPTILVSSIISMTNVLCNDDSTGSAIAEVTGGIPPYSFTWFPSGINDDTASALSAGTHFVIVTDSNNCTVTDTAVITEPTALILMISDTVKASCGLSNGSATVAPTGGTPPYNYLWSTTPLQTDSTATGLASGTYLVTVTESNSCLAMDSVEIAQIQPLTISLATSAVSSCGASDGAVDLTVTGGISPFTFFWSNGDSTQNISGVPAGNYSLTIIDSLECAANASATVSQTLSYTISITTGDVTCAGGSNGSANLTLSGGVTPFTFLWSTGDTSEDLLDIPTGIYSVTVTDSDGCQGYDSVVVNELPLNPLGVMLQDVSICGGSNGVASASITGGTPPYSYLWTSGDTTAVDSGLSAGFYSVMVTDAYGCVATGIVAISEIPAPSVSFVITPPTCYGYSNSSIDVTLSGGTPPFMYQWSNGSNTEDISGLTSGVYQLQINDSAGCISAASVTVNDPLLISLTFNATLASCNTNDGSATASVSGGTPPYNYMWSSGGITSSATGLSAGVYSLAVSDANGCLATGTVSVNNAGAPAVTVDSVVNITCGNPASGAVYISVSGGLSPYAYLWSNGDTIQDIANLYDTSYSVTVTDINNCIGAISAEVVYQMPPTTPICLITVDSINGKNLLVWDKTAGITTYKIYREYSTGNFNMIATIPSDSLSEYVDYYANPGQQSWRYKITATDSCGIESVLSLPHKTMYLAANPDISGTKINLNWDSYQGFNYGIIKIYRGTTQNSIDSINFVAGNLNNFSDLNPLTGQVFYKIAVDHPAGCTAGKTNNYSSSLSNTKLTSISAGALSATTTTTNATQGNCDGSATASASGGTQPYTYTWSTNPIQTTAVADSLCGNTSYTVLVTDASGDTVSASVFVDEATGMEEQGAGLPQLLVYPNPNDGTFTIETTNRQAIGSIRVFNILGEVVYAEYADEDKTVVGLKGQAAGVYHLMVISESGVGNKIIVVE